MKLLDGTGVSRRTTLRTLALGGAAVAVPAAFAQAPAVRKPAKISYWTWADNPSHHKMLVDAVDAFNKSQSFVSVQLDAGSRTAEVRQKVMVSFAAGAAPDIAGTVQTDVQDYYESGVLSPVDPFFSKWDERNDYFPNIVTFMHSKPGQPALYMPSRILPYVLYYRTDWFEAAKVAPPMTYDEFIEAARRLTKPGDRAGYAMRGMDYYAVQPLEPIWGSAGVQFVRPDGKVDFTSAAAVDVTTRWVNLFTEDKATQSTVITDSYPQLFALMEKGRAAMWIYGTHASPQLSAALGGRIAVVPTPNVGPRNCMLANPEGDFMTTSCKEKEAAWEFLRYMASGSKETSMLAQGRGYLPVRTSLSKDPGIQANRFFQVAIGDAKNWWTPPFAAKGWANYTDKIAPYWQQALRRSITPTQWHQKAAALLDGQV